MACLDTTVLLHLGGRRGKKLQQAARDRVRQITGTGDPLTTTRFNVAELWVGVERSTDPQPEEAALDSMLGGLEILEFDPHAARLYGRFIAHLQRIGRPVGDMDVLIAAVAVANGQTLVTANVRHFVDIPLLEVTTY